MRHQFVCLLICTRHYSGLETRPVLDEHITIQHDKLQKTHNKQVFIVGPKNHPDGYIPLDFSLNMSNRVGHVRHLEPMGLGLELPLSVRPQGPQGPQERRPKRVERQDAA